MEQCLFVLAVRFGGWGRTAIACAWQKEAAGGERGKGRLNSAAAAALLAGNEHAPVLDGKGGAPPPSCPDACPLAPLLLNVAARAGCGQDQGAGGQEGRGGGEDLQGTAACTVLPNRCTGVRGPACHGLPAALVLPSSAVAALSLRQLRPIRCACVVLPAAAAASSTLPPLYCRPPPRGHTSPAGRLRPLNGSMLLPLPPVVAWCATAGGQGCGGRGGGHDAQGRGHHGGEPEEAPARPPARTPWLPPASRVFL